MTLPAKVVSKGRVECSLRLDAGGDETAASVIHRNPQGFTLLKVVRNLSRRFSSVTACRHQGLARAVIAKVPKSC